MFRIENHAYTCHGHQVWKQSTGRCQRLSVINSNGRKLQYYRGMTLRLASQQPNNTIIHRALLWPYSALLYSSAAVLTVP